MRILLVHNHHRYGGGSDVVARNTASLLTTAGHETATFFRDSRDLEALRGRGNLTAFFSGLYNPFSLAQFKRALNRFRPEIVHMHSLFPLITPWIIPLCRQYGIPCVMSCHDYTLTCPIYTHLRHGQICVRCAEKNEIQCVRHNCADKATVSAAYALRNGMARLFKLYEPVTLFLTPSTFAKEWLVQYAGIPADRIAAVGNPVSPPLSITPYQPEKRPFIGYAGRFSAEKGIDILLDAATRVNLPIKLAGDTRALRNRALGPNVQAVGLLDPSAMSSFLNLTRFIVVPSLWHETFNLVAAEAMAHGLPVICSRLGALQELVSDGVNGLWTEPGSPADLARQLSRLWSDTDLCRRMSASALHVAERFTPENYLKNIETAYQKALRLQADSPPPDRGSSALFHAGPKLD